LEYLRNKSLLQRRGSISNTLQASFDGLATIGAFWGLMIWNFGALTPEYIIMLLLLIGCMTVIYDYFSLYRTNRNFTRKAYILLKSWTVSFLVLTVLAFLSKQSDSYSRVFVGQFFLVGYLLQLLMHFCVGMTQKAQLKYGQSSQNAILIGDGLLVNYLNEKINANSWLAQNVVGKITYGEKSNSLEGGGKDNGPKLLGTIDELTDILKKNNVKVVYLIIPLESSNLLEGLYSKLLQLHVEIHWVPDIFSLRLVNHSVKELAGIPLMTLSETPLTGSRLVMKSIEDRVFSAIILVLISPVFLVIACAIKINSSGPVYFRQKRAGWDGEVFNIWKFRSMYVHTAENGALKQAEKNDSRITGVGAFLRKTSLDELPQLLNVLAGDMSLVGPRPHAVQHDEEYSQRISDYFVRNKIKPGMTGLAQVRGFRGETKNIDQMIQRVESDIEYINNWSIWLDLVILLRTVAVLKGETAY